MERLYCDSEKKR